MFVHQWMCDPVTNAGTSRKEPSDAHLFDPRFDVMAEPQLSSCSLIGAQNMSDLSV